VDRQIVPLADLLAWRASLGKRGRLDYPNHALGEWLDINEAKDTNGAIKVLEQALKCLPALAAQIEEYMITGDEELRG
jgi:hypothetical protein